MLLIAALALSAALVQHPVVAIPATALPSLAATTPPLSVPAAPTPTPAPAATAPVPHEAPVRAALAGQAPAGIVLWDLSRWRASLEALYTQRRFAPLWFAGSRLTPAGKALLQQFDAAESRGLLAVDYDGPQLRLLATQLAAIEAANPDAVARLDVAMSIAVARLASDLHQGRIPPASVGSDLAVARPAFDAGAAVARLASTSDAAAALDALEPQLRQYSQLKLALARYRQLAGQPELTHLPALARRSVRAGEVYGGAPALRRLLSALGDLVLSVPPATSAATPGSAPPIATAPTDVATAAPTDAVAAALTTASADGATAAPTAARAEDLTLDPQLVAALMRFQSRHGLEVDGILGRRTLRELTTPLAARVQQIVLSLERVRWLPPRLEPPPVIVNIPQFRLFALRTAQDRPEDILQMDVIVGSDFKGRRTPVFAADMRYVVLNPYWDVPRSILLKELLADIRANPRWLDKNGYEMVRGQGDDALVQAATRENVELLARGALRLRQKPGPENSLGQVKFMFPNRHGVYLHDTPARSLFNRSRRAFSHGCIRVSQPMALLAHVLRADPTWTAERIAAALEGGTPVRIELSAPIRVYILYGTALATQAGALFFEDLYDQDGRLTGLLASRRSRAIAATPRVAR